MYLSTKDVKKIGFKGSGMFVDSKYNHFYYATVPNKKQVYIIDNYDQSVSHFSLSEMELKNFNKGKLSLIPIGCCSVGGGKCKYYPTLDFNGDFKESFRTKNKTIEFIKKLMGEPL